MLPKSKKKTSILRHKHNTFSNASSGNRVKCCCLNILSIVFIWIQVSGHLMKTRPIYFLVYWLPLPKFVCQNVRLIMYKVVYFHKTADFFSVSSYTCTLLMLCTFPKHSSSTLTFLHLNKMNSLYFFSYSQVSVKPLHFTDCPSLGAPLQ